ncbi:D-2-hydroxyacid dehydrogenase [Halorussus amylolyticus]|uniref:D-2-hydroxyacid dehydrogenase n=1 Tax=Halorussus amylolyticus TaxID=1126242 RepID=UPI0010507402|nr:D-2-hydroxyacid dehydrogenase [Halorussus amylolyticus]
MSQRPDVLIPHYVSDSARDSLLDGLDDRLPDLEPTVATTPPETDDHLPDAEILVTLRLPTEKLASAENLRWVQALSAGVDSYDLDALENRDIALTNASGVHAEPIGEQVLAYMLVFERNIHKGIAQQHRGVWERYGGRELRDETVGILGVGEIGGRVAELASAFGMEVLGTKRTPETAPDAVDEAFGPDGLYEVLERSDYVVVACPLTDETEGLLGEEELRTMPSSGVLVNIARGEIVEEDALTTALQQGWIRGAALDVFEEEPLPGESPLWDLSNVVATPHMAGSTPHYYDRCADLFARNYERYLAGETEAFENRIV